MDTGGRSSEAPRIEVGSVFRSPTELRAAASKRFPEDCRDFTAGNGGGRQNKYYQVLIVLFLRCTPGGEKGRKNRAGCPFSDVTMY